MTWRVLKGQNLAGAFGLWVSRPGFDVTTANIMQMAFSSDIKTPLLVAKGSITVNPTTGTGYAAVPGGEPTASVIPFGRTISPVPFVVAIASAPSWTMPLITNQAQLAYLNNQWHTYIFDTPSGRNPNYGTANPVIVGNTVGAGFSAARFIANTYSDRAEFLTNCRSVMTIKYIVLEY